MLGKVRRGPNSPVAKIGSKKSTLTLMDPSMQKRIETAVCDGYGEIQAAKTETRIRSNL